jgi:hypothetical protein
MKEPAGQGVFVGAPQGAMSWRLQRHSTAGHPFRGFRRSHISLIAIGVYSRSFAVFFPINGHDPFRTDL